MIYLFPFPNSNKRMFFVSACTIYRIDSSIGGISGQCSLWSGWRGIWGRSGTWYASRYLRRDMFQRINEGWLSDKSVGLFFTKMDVTLRRADTAALNFRNEMHIERDANKTPTHQRLPRKHARRGIVNIWTSKRGKHRLIGGCWLFSGWPLFFAIQFFVRKIIFFLNYRHQK